MTRTIPGLLRWKNGSSGAKAKNIFRTCSDCGSKKRSGGWTIRQKESKKATRESWARNEKKRESSRSQPRVRAEDVMNKIREVMMCGFCGKQVPLENCKTDEHGHAVHENCAVVMLTSKRLGLRRKGSQRVIAFVPDQTRSISG